MRPKPRTTALCRSQASQGSSDRWSGDAQRTNDRFDPFRCGLDHLSFSVATKADLEAAVQAFEERGVEHSDITDLPPFGIAVLPFKDPDGLALELTAPL